MNKRLEDNLTQLNDNRTFYISPEESIIRRNNITYVGFYLHQPSTAAIFIMSYLLIFLVCMVGNGVVCFIVLRSKNMRTVTNLFILNLAVSDILVGIFCMPTTLLDNIITGEQDSNLKLETSVHVVIVVLFCVNDFKSSSVAVWNIANTVGHFSTLAQTEITHQMNGTIQDLVNKSWNPAGSTTVRLTPKSKLSSSNGESDA